jgi:hypothetical protein
MTVIPATWEAEIGKVTAEGQPGEKSPETSPPKKKAGHHGKYLSSGVQQQEA